MFIFSLFHGKLLRMYKYVFSLENRFLYILGFVVPGASESAGMEVARGTHIRRPFSFRMALFSGARHPLGTPSFLKPQDCSLGWTDIARHIFPGFPSSWHLSTYSPWFSKLHVGRQGGRQGTGRFLPVQEGCPRFFKKARGSVFPFSLGVLLSGDTSDSTNSSAEGCPEV